MRFRPGRFRARVLRSMLAIVLISAAVPAALLTRPFTGSNLGIVHAGRVIRAAQPTSGLRQLIQDYQLASILNLRGGSSKDPWYRSEVETSTSMGVEFYDLPLNATRRPKRGELLTLIDTLAKCKYPLMIHCKAGADRTGLASAVYLMMHEAEPPREAMRSFTIYHSHIPWFGTQHLHEPLDEYASWLDAKALPHTPERFRAWVKDEYRSDDPNVDPPLLSPGPRRPI